MFRFEHLCSLISHCIFHLPAVGSKPRDGIIRFADEKGAPIYEKTATWNPKTLGGAIFTGVAVDSKPARKTGECGTRPLVLGNSVLKISLEISFQELLQNVEAKSGIADFDFEEQLRGGQLVEEVHGSGGFRGAKELEIVFDLLLLLLESFESAVLNGNAGDKLLLEDVGVAGTYESWRKFRPRDRALLTKANGQGKMER